MTGITVKKRVVDGQPQLLAFREDGRWISTRTCEDIGEDHGLYDPQTTTAYGAGDPPNARIITEGFKGELCVHRWDSRIHFSRNPYGYIYTCGLCGVTATESYRKRALKGTFHYDVWELREGVWRAWTHVGPRPNSLSVQPHHQAGDARE